MERDLRVLIYSLVILFFAVDCLYADVKRPDTIREVFFTGTNHELEVYKIYGRQDGPTMLIIGGIQGDEPGGFLSADSYTEIKLEKGNLIVIPRTNFYSIMLFNREVKGVDMNRLFDKTPDDWQGDIINKLKEYMKESDIFLNLHDGWGFHYPEHISWHKSPDRFGYSVIVDEEEYTCSNGKTLKLGEMAKKAMDAANEKIPDDDPKKHYFNTETSKSSSRFKSMRKSATWYAVSDLCIPAFGIEGSKNMKLDKNVLYHNYVINEFMKNTGIEIEYPNTHTYEPEFTGAVIKVHNDELFIRSGKVLEVEKDSKIIFRKDNVVMGSITIKAVEPVKQAAAVKDAPHKEIEIPVKEQERVKLSSEESKISLEPYIKYFHLTIDNKDVYIKNGDKIHIKNGSKVVFVKLLSSKVQDYNVAINFKGWFPADNSANIGDDRGYEIIFPPANILKKYSVGSKGKLYPVVAYDTAKKQDIAEILVELD